MSAINKQSKRYFRVVDILEDFTDPKMPHNRVLVVGGQKFYVYAGHLSFVSEFFRTLFYSDFKEKEEQEIEIKEVDPEEFHAFLKTLIPGKTDIVNAANYSGIMSCARRFLAPIVMQICAKFVSDNFDSLNKVELLKFAFEYNVKHLKDKLEVLMTLNSSSSTCTVYPVCSSYTGQCANCHSMVPTPTNQMPSILHNKEELFKLPDEIQAFMFRAMVKSIKK